MANNGGRRSAPPGNNSSLILGILIGMVLGLAAAGGVAWHLSNRPSPFAGKDQHETQAAASAAQPATPPKQATAATAPQGNAASGVNGNKQHFTFYEMLPDKDNGNPKATSHTASATKGAPKPSAGDASGGNAYFLQAGSFSSADDAGKLKEKLALLGMESSVQTADVPGKGTYYRVRLGPYHNAEELNKANATLKQNGINGAAQVRAQ